MSLTKRAMIIGAVPALAVIAFTIYNAKELIAFRPGGILMLTTCVLAAGITWAGIAIKPDVEKRFYPLYIAAFFFIVPLLNVMTVERMNGNFLHELKHMCWIDNYCVCLLIYILMFAISGSVRISAMTLTPFFFLFGLANMYVKEFKGGPLVPMDVGSIATATTVAGDFTYDIGAEACFAAAISIMVIALASRLKMPVIEKRYKIAGRLAGLVIVGCMAGVYYGTDVLVKLGYKPDFFNQMRGYNNYGAILEFTVNTRYLKLAKPDGYDAEELPSLVNEVIGDGSGAPQILASGDHDKEKTAKDKEITNPDIIVVMDEAFSDLSVIGDFRTDKDPMPFLNSLKSSTLQGNAYVSVLGSGTSNTEFEFLTGNSMSYLAPGSNAYQLYIKDTQPGLAGVLKARGYQTQALHPYFKENWNRPNVYKYMGFDKYRAFEDMFDKDIVDEYKSGIGLYVTLRKKMEEKYGDDNILLRKYVSDEYDFKEVIRMYEDRDKTKPYFMLNVTMQNHSPYNLYLSSKRERVKLKELSGEYELAEQYLSIVRETDKALKELIGYFEKVKRPTVIVFFGDHQPFIEKGFYKEVMGDAMSDLADEEKMKIYCTRFMIWSNFNTPSGWVDHISMNYLSTMIMQMTGMELTDFNKFLANMYQRYPVITALGGFDKNGKYEDVSAEGTEILSTYHKLIYNNLIDYENLIPNVFD